MLRALLGLPVHLYHAHLGVLLGHRFLHLVHTGRKTGWLHNVAAGLAHEVWTGRQRFAPAWRILPPDEAERLLADYERRNRLIAPIIRAVLSRLLGWRYDGTPAARRRAVEQLALVAFRPPPDGEPAPRATGPRA